jgi:hypothetical protein
MPVVEPNHKSELLCQAAELSACVGRLLCQRRRACGRYKGTHLCGSFSNPSKSGGTPLKHSQTQDDKEQAGWLPDVSYTAVICMPHATCLKHSLFLNHLGIANCESFASSFNTNSHKSQEMLRWHIRFFLPCPGAELV